MIKYVKVLMLTIAVPGILLLVSGCSVKHVNQAGDGRNIVEQIQMEEIEEKTEIRIVAKQPVVYTAFKLTDPLRIVVDINQADVSGITSPVTVANGTVHEIVTTQFGEEESYIGRIELVLDGMADYDIKKDGVILTVSISSISTGESAEDKQMVEAGLEVVGAEGGGLVATSATDKQSPPGGKKKGAVGPVAVRRPSEKLPKNKAKTIRSITVEKGVDFVDVVISGEGYIGDYNAFRLGRPYRVVVDVTNVKNLSKKSKVNVNSPILKRIRIGKHKNKIRFVLDANGKTPPQYSIRRSGKSLIVSLGKGASERRSDGMPVSSAVSPVDISPVIASKSMPGGIVKLSGINFTQMPGLSRVAITGSEGMKFDVKELSPGKTAIDVRGARIPKNLQRSLDTREFDSPVQMISSYQFKGAPDNIVRIVVATKGAAKYHAAQEGNAIFFDVEREMKSTEEEPLAVAVVVGVKSEVSGAKAPAGKDDGTDGKKYASPVLDKIEMKQEDGLSIDSDLLMAKDAPIEEQDESSGYKGQRVSLDYKDADIGNVLRLFAEVSGLNIIAADDVRGTVTVKLNDVPWDQAFDIILASKGLGMSKRGNVVRIAPMDKLLKEEEAQLTAAKGKEKLEPLVSAIIPVSHAPVAEIGSKIKSLLTERGTVTTDERSSLLIVNDIERTINESKKLVEVLDKPTPQVLIEARIVEVDTNYTKDLGVQWGSRYTADAAHGNALGYRFPNSMDVGIAGGGGFALNAPSAGFAGTGGAGGQAGGAIGISFGSIDNTVSLDLKLSALESRGVSKIVSRPRIVVINKKEAEITQGLSIPFETTSAEGTQTTFIDATLSLKVTPEVKPDGSIILTIEAKKNEPDFARSGARGQPSIAKKEAKTQVLIKDGDTTVIGGIFTQKKGKNVAGIPFLSKLPFIGWLFRSTSTTDDKAELLIFVTPRILKSAI